MTYTVSTVTTSANGLVTATNIADFDDKAKAMKIAKRLAKARDCQSYGPSSLAYVGHDLTAVVAW